MTPLSVCTRIVSLQVVIQAKKGLFCRMPKHFLVDFVSHLLCAIAMQVAQLCVSSAVVAEKVSVITCRSHVWHVISLCRPMRITCRILKLLALGCWKYLRCVSSVYHVHVCACGLVGVCLCVCSVSVSVSVRMYVLWLCI